MTKSTSPKMTKAQRVRASHDPATRQRPGYSNPLQRDPDPKMRGQVPETLHGTPTKRPRRSTVRKFRHQFGWSHTVHPWRARLYRTLHDRDGSRLASRGKRGKRG